MVIVLPLVLFPLLVVGVLIEGTHGDFATALTNAAEFSTPSAAGLLYLNLTLGATVLWTWGLIRVLHQMRPRWLSSVVPKLRWKFLLVCVGLGAVALGASIVVGMLVPSSGSSGGGGGDHVSTGRAVALGLVVLLTTPLQAAGEEYAFRGYLLQAVGALTRNKWVTIVITAGLFATAHLQFAPPLFLDRFLFGLVAGWLVIRTGGLESGIALHVLNNYLALGLAILSGDLVTTLSSPSADWWELIPSLTQTLVFAGLVAWVAGRMKLQTKTRPPVPEEPSAALVSA
jgi:membrane protease YdiL (CAAX protease family)